MSVQLQSRKEHEMTENCFLKSCEMSQTKHKKVKRVKSKKKKKKSWLSSESLLEIQHKGFPIL